MTSKQSNNIRPPSVDSNSEAVWILNPPGQKAETLSRELDLPLAFAQVLVNRDISTPDRAERFLHASLGDLYDPYLMAGMKAAVERIEEAKARREKILIFGDYDVDGILSVVVLRKALESLGAEVSYFIPERLKKGYGIKEEYIDIVINRGAKLVISVDCGTRAVGFVGRARDAGIDVIITDHHQPGDTLPDALAILNPVLETAGYPYPKLAGIGVVFKLIQALFQRAGKTAVLSHYLKLVSIATVADVAELRDENRIFVKHGLEKLESVTNTGLMSLMKICGLNGRRVSVGDVGFRLGPRINAAGRLGMTDAAVQLFFSDSPEEARELVQTLDKLNAQRQKIEEKILDQSLSWVKRKGLAERYRILILGCQGWHRGVIGIVASKLKDAFYRPVILFAYENGRAFGSGRSIPDFSLIECLEENREIFSNFGGHPAAVGCELPMENIDLLKQRINRFAETRLGDDLLKKKIFIDARIDFDHIDQKFVDLMAQFSPYGVGNPRPVFFTEGVEIFSPPQKLKGRHVKLIVKQSGRIFEALGWDKGRWADELARNDVVSLVYSPQISDFRGEERLNLHLVDIRRG